MVFFRNNFFKAILSLSFAAMLFSCTSTELAFTKKNITLSGSEEFYEFTKINAGNAVLYAPSKNKKNITVALNAGHGTTGGTAIKTQCHPDGSAKYISGSTEKGATEAWAVSGGTVMLDGTSEADANLALARLTKDILLQRGYSVLMIRDGDDVQLDNIARTVLANNNASCHIALHYDSSTNDKGVFFCSVPDIESYKKMYPLSEHWESHQTLGFTLVDAISKKGMGVYKNGAYDMDLTQTSYSTVPSVDLEVGDRASDRSEATLLKTAEGIADGLDAFFSEGL